LQHQRFKIELTHNAIPNPTAADCLKTIIYWRFKFPCNRISRAELPMAISKPSFSVR